MSNRLGFLAEMGVLFGVICTASLLFRQGDPAFLDAPLHPFLLVIAILGINYGLNEALISSGVALAIYLGALLIHTGGFPLTDGNHAYILFSFVATGALLGLTQEGRNRQMRHLRSELEEVRNESERLRQRMQVLNTANQRLNERILGEVSTVQSFAEIARRLSVLEERDLYPAICELAQEFVHASEASVYMLSGEKLVLTAQKGWEAVPAEAQVLTRGSDLLWTALDQKKAVTAIDLGTPPEPGEDLARRYRRLVCAPIVHPETHQAMGVISVDRLPFSYFHGNSVSVLSVIAKWAGDSLYNAATFREVANQLTGDELIGGCLAPVLFRDRVQQELADRGHPVAFITLLIQGYHTLAAPQQAELRQKLDEALRPLLEAHVVLGRLAEGFYGFLLRGQPESQAQAFRERLLATLAEQVRGSLSPKVSLLAGLNTLGEGDLALNRLIACGLQNLQKG